MSSSNGDGDKKGPDSGLPRFNFNNRVALITLLVLVVIFILFFASNQTAFTHDISYSDFLNSVEQNGVRTVKIIDGYEIQGQFSGGTGEMFRTTIPYSDPSLIAKLQEKGVQITGGPRSVSPLRVFIDFLPWMIGFIFIWFMFRQVQGSGNRAFSFGKSRAKRFVESSKKINFKDVAGQEEAKYELLEVVEFLKNPGKFAKMGARIPKGVLLVGHPGTGKTLMAKAVAGEANAPFFHMSGSDFVEMFVGVGASRVRDLFEQGRKNAPCILFIDELDAVGRTRGAGYGGGHDEREQTLNQMLVEMDGFDTKDGVIIIAATNRPDVLDPALLRPGRFDRQVVVDMPDVKGREEILAIHAAKVPLADDVDLDRAAKQTPGFSGADLANLVNEAALLAARENKEKVTGIDLSEARDKVMMGVAKRSRVMTEEERRLTAVHEAGHALLALKLEDAADLDKVTIIPRGRAAGFTAQLPEENSGHKRKRHLMAEITVLMGGYAAELIKFGETNPGAQQDIEMATNYARQMVSQWGMGSSKLGPVAYGRKEEPIFLGKEIATHQDYSEDTARQIDTEVKQIVEGRLMLAGQILKESEDKLDELTELLLKKETVDDREITEHLGLPPQQHAEKLEDGENSAPQTESADDQEVIEQPGRPPTVDSGPEPEAT